MKTVRKAVITAAGRGTRQYPASSAIQKEMFPLVDVDGLAKPVIQIIGEEALGAGIEEICIVTQPGEERIYRDYFRGLSSASRLAFANKAWALAASEQLQRFGERLRFVSQTSPEGYGHAVYQARDFVGDEPFLLMLGDHIYISDQGKENCAAQLLASHARSGLPAISAVQVEPAQNLRLFGTIRGTPLPSASEAGDVYRAEAIVEKPAADYARKYLRTPGLPPDHYLCHFGLHVFPPEIFEALGYHIERGVREDGEFQLTAAQEFLRRELLVGNYGACTLAGQRFDTGIPSGWMEAQLALGLSGKHRGQIVAAWERLMDRSQADREKA